MDTTPKSIHDTNLLRPAEQKYAVQEHIPKTVKHDNLLLPSCSNSFLFQLLKTWDKVSGFKIGIQGNKGAAVA
jgi:hypothetical protein